MSTARMFLVSLATLLAAWTPALALEPEQREVVVLSGRVWEGYEYKEIFVPSTKDEMTLIAGKDSAVAFVRTLEYYWPLSRQVYVDFQRQRDVLQGELVVRRGGTEVAREPLSRFSILYPQGAVHGQGRLLWGEEAEHAYAEHREEERRFAREFAAARRAHTVYERQLLEAGAARIRGEEVETIEAPPPLQKPSLRLVTTPQPGFHLSLPPGDYSIVLEEAGQPVPGTQRRLRVTDLSGSEALVADVVPAERWTQPLASNAPPARIFARPGAVFYMTLTEASHFDEVAYLPVVSPQAEPVAGRSLWVRRRPAEVERLRVNWRGQGEETLARGRLKVEQTRGASFGYRVRSAREDETEDLNAFTIAVPDDPAISRGWIGPDGQAQLPFTREVVVVRARRSGLGIGLALLPFAGFVVFACWRWRKESNRNPRPLSEI